MSVVIVDKRYKTWMGIAIFRTMHAVQGLGQKPKVSREA